MSSVRFSASLDQQQTKLVNSILATGTPTVAVALRTPYDLVAFPTAATYLCSYGIRPPSLHATAAALFGRIAFPGRLPVTIPDLYEAGHGITGK